MRQSFVIARHGSPPHAINSTRTRERDTPRDATRGGLEQLFGMQSQAVTLWCVVGRRARRGRVQDNDGMSGEYHVDGQASE